MRAAFEENFRSRGETSASVCVYKDGRPVVDLWGGSWQQDSVGLVFSATKGLTAVAALMLVESGRLEVDAPVAQYWPEFAAAGKQRVTVRQLLCHQAGLVGFSRVMMMKDMRAWDPLIADLGAQAPGWEPGSGFGYHALTFGWLVPMTAVCCLALAAATLARSANIGVAAGMSGWVITVLAGQAAAGRLTAVITDSSLILPYLAFAACCGAVAAGCGACACAWAWPVIRFR